MRIGEFHIDGFGRFADVSFADVPAGLSIVLGDNEAGKSTLLAFLQSVLFGLPSRKQKDYYPPFRGGHKGGRIVLFDQQSDRYIVERFEGKGTGPLTVTFPDGSQHGEEEFRPLIGSATADLYRNVFAFSLTELQTLDSLNTDKVRDAIYSAGVGVGPRTITEIVRELNKQSDELFARGGSKPAMNQVLGRVETLSGKIKDHTRDQDEYQRIQSELEAAESDIQQITTKLNDARRRHHRVQLLQQAWDDWITLGDNRRELQALPRIVSFPEDGVKRLDALNTERRGFHDQLAVAGRKKQSDEANLAGIEIDDTFLNAAAEVRRLDRGLDLYEQEHRKHPAIENERETAEKRLATSLRELGEEWDESKLSEFDLSIPVREEFDACRQKFVDAKRAVGERRVQWDQQRQLHEEASGLERDARTQFEQLPQPSELLAVDDIQKLQLGRESYENAARDLPGVRKQCETRVAHLLDTLRKIGPTWTEDRLTEFDTSLTVQEAIATHGKRLADLRSDHQEATRRAQDADQALVDTRGDLDRAEAILAALPEPEVKDEAELAERRRTVRTLRSLVNDAEKRAARLAHLAERKQDLEARIARLKEDLLRESLPLPAWVVSVVLVTGLAGLVALGIGRSDWIAGSIVFTLSAIVCVLLAVARRLSFARAEDGRTDRLNEITELESRSAELDRETGKLRQELTDADSEVRAQVQSTGIVDRPDARTLDEAEGLVERHLDALQRRRPAEQKRDEALTSVAKANEAVSRTKQTATAKSQQFHDAQEQWRQWLVETGLPETLSPDNAANVLARLDAAREQLKAISSDRERISGMTDAIRNYGQQVAAVSVASGFDRPVSEDVGATVDFLVARLKEHEEQVRAQDEASRRLDEATKQAGRAKSKTDEAESLHRDAVTVEEQCEQQWTSLLQRLGLRDSLAVEHAPQMMQAIETARDRLGRVDEQRKRQRTSREVIDSYCRDVRSLAGILGRAEPADGDVSQTISALVSELDQAEEQRRWIDNLKEKIKEHEDGIDVLRKQIEQRDREIEELLKAAGTPDEEAFRRAAADFETRRTLEDEIRQIETRLHQLVGSGDAFRMLEDELRQTTPEDLSAEQSALEETIRTLEPEQTDAADLRGRLKEQLERLEKSEELSRLRIEEQAARAEFAAGAEQWSILKITTHLIDQARMKYERERRPAVLKEAERFFANFTKGTYTEIRVPVDSDQFVLIAPDGSTKDVTRLSRGTAEQLYLALRFGFVREFVRRSEPIPLVFDDILVNFDPGRARATAEAILELSRSLQILLFTCHPSTVELMKEVEAGIPVFSLKDGRFAPL